MLGVYCCMGFSLVAASRGYSLAAGHGLLTVVACPCGEHLRGLQASVVAACGLRGCGSQALQQSLNSCGSWSQLLHCMHDLSGSGIQPVVSCTGRRILYHCTTREAPQLCVLTDPKHTHRFVISSAERT